MYVKYLYIVSGVPEPHYHIGGSGSSMGRYTDLVITIIE